MIRLRWPGMRYTKAALLLFGLGLIVGFVAVVGEITRLEPAASMLMALGLLGVPVGLFADGRGFRFLRWVGSKFAGRPAAPPRPASRASKAASAKKPTAKAAKPRRPPARTQAGKPRRKRS